MTDTKVLIGASAAVLSLNTPEDVIAAYGAERRNPDGSPANISAAACDLLRAPRPPLTAVRVPAPDEIAAVKARVAPESDAFLSHVAADGTLVLVRPGAVSEVPITIGVALDEKDGAS